MMPFTGHKQEDIRSVIDWLIDVDKEFGLGAEALDAFLSEWKATGDLGKAVWFANCEWDL